MEPSGSLKEEQPGLGSIGKLVVDWLNSQDNLATAQSLEGGWEIWAQVQIALLMKKYGNEGVALREKRNIYLKENSRVDLYVEQPKNNPNKTPDIGVELKCRTKGENIGVFQRRILQDINKIRAGVTPEVKPLLMYAMAITGSPADLDGWSKYKAPEYPEKPKAYFKAGAWYVIAWPAAFKVPEKPGV